MERRPLVLIFLSFTSGIILAGNLVIKSVPAWSIAVISFLIIILALTEYLEIKGSTEIAILALALCGLIFYGARYFEPGNLYTELKSLEKIEGKVVSYPLKTRNGTEFRLKPFKYRGKIKVFLKSDEKVEPEYGDKLVVSGQFEVPRVFEGFSYREFLRKKGIWGVVYRGKVTRSQKGFGNPVLEFGWTMRKLLSRRIAETLPERGRFLEALLFGKSEALRQKTEKYFTKTGLAHLLAASGLHLGIILGLTWWLATVTGLRRETTYIVSLPLVLCYLVLVGFKLPLLRASIIYFFGGVHLWFKQLGIILDGWYDRYQALAGAALLLVIVNPETISTVGFQLSFGATFALALFFQPIKELLPVKPDYFGGILAASLSAQLGVSPVIAVHFGRVHPWAPFINLIAIPGVSAVLYLGILVLILGGELASLTALGSIASKAILLFRRIIGKFAEFPYVSIDPPAPTSSLLVSYFILLYWLWRRLNIDRSSVKILKKIEIDG